MGLYFTETKDKSKTEQAIDYINEALIKISSEEKSLQKSILGAECKIMEVKPANLMGKVNSNIASYIDVQSINKLDAYSNSNRYSSKNNVEKTCNIALLHADTLLNASKEIHEANLVSIENNKLLDASIRAIMKKIGIPSSYTIYDYISSSGRRTQKKQEHTQYAGYTGDLMRWVKTEDGFSTAEASYKNFIQRIEDYRKTEQQKETNALRIKQAEEQKIADNTILATLRVKYATDYQAEYSDILDVILYKNKYLELGYWLERQRNSWADGFWKARDGINKFKVETDIDGYIHDEITSLLEDCEDGRVFRDCQYNYSVLYGMVDDTELLKDFQLVFGKIVSDLD